MRIGIVNLSVVHMLQTFLLVFWYLVFWYFLAGRSESGKFLDNKIAHDDWRMGIKSLGRTVWDFFCIVVCEWFFAQVFSCFEVLSQKGFPHRRFFQEGVWAHPSKYVCLAPTQVL